MELISILMELDAQIVRLTAQLAQTGPPARHVHKVMNCLTGRLLVPRFRVELISGFMELGAQIVRLHWLIAQFAQTGPPARHVHKVMNCLTGRLPVPRFRVELISGFMELGAQIVWLTALLAMMETLVRHVHLGSTGA